MNVNTLALVQMCVFCIQATSLGAEPLPDLAFHSSQSLDGEWRIIIDPYETGFYDYRYQQRDRSRNPNRSETFYLDAKPTNPSDRVEYDFDRSPTLRVPGDWNTQMPELYYYEGSVWYRKSFEAKRTDGERAFLRFGAANYRADVYLNGSKLGMHVGGFTPFSFEVTGQLKSGTNSLVVRVDNKRHKSGVPTLNTDWWNYGGLTRSVKLVHTSAQFISEHRLHLESDDSNTLVGWVKVEGAAEGDTAEVVIAELRVHASAETDRSGLARFRIETPGVERWSPEQPRLYDVVFRYGNDSISEPIGFRTVRTRGKEILLNGEPVFLRGISIHEELALDGGGRVNSPAKAKQLLEWAKQLHCNFVRLAHYPHNESMTRLADKMGLMVWSEVPVYWTIDWANDQTYQLAEQQVVEMIRRDASRASVIIWSLANETPTSDARNRFLSRLARKTRALDPTRLVSAAMEKHGKRGEPNVNVVQDPLADIVDVVAFNEYVGWYDGLPDKCDRVSWEIPYDKPVVVSEFGGGAKYGFHGDKTQRWTEEFQADIYRQTLPMLDKIDGFVGCTPWALVDFRSPRRVLPDIQAGFNRKGLISDSGQKKEAFYVLRDYYQMRAADGDE